MPQIGPVDLRCSLRVFARLFELDLECIGCRQAFHLTSAGRNRRPYSTLQKWKRNVGQEAYDHRSGRFKCPSCGFVVALGVPVYPVDDDQPQIEWNDAPKPAESDDDHDTPPSD